MVKKGEMCFEGWIKRVWIWAERRKGRDSNGDSSRRCGSGGNA